MPKPVPQARIAGFHQDDEGHWVADLDCGHTQHVRHQPPWQERPWVITEEGRSAHIGASLPCPACRMPKLPPGAREYKRTGELDAATVPAALTRSHRLKRDVWGEIAVVAGRVLYVIEEEPPLSFMLRPGLHGVIAPEQPHHVEPEPGARFFVRFMR